MQNACYECKWRRDQDGTHHSQCHISGQLIGSILILGIGKSPKGSQHGINHGWFSWPFDFDPVWLEECVFFSRKEEQHEKESMPVPKSESVEVPVPNANAAGGCIANYHDKQVGGNTERPTVSELHEESQQSK